MNMMTEDFSEHAFYQHFIQNAPQLMWFLGSGVSRTAGMPTATDIIWDLKRRYYCLHENQDLQTHDIHNKAIRRKIQEYCDSKGFPSLWSQGEYSFYFDLIFGIDHNAQRNYIIEQLNSNKISLNIGHRIIATLLEMGLTRIIFTTNFDEVVETAFSFVTGKNLSPFHIEGSYAALDALNAERFPIYSKIHGDFRYQSIKNLASDLLNNDQELQKCFLAACNRYGLIVTGYSGRDENVMRMFRLALDQNNPFPNGLFWTTTDLNEVSQSVTELIDYARTKGVRAHVVETGTFDIMLTKMWRQLPQKLQQLDMKVQTAKSHVVSIPLPPKGKRFPILRTNALAVTEYPQNCAIVNYTAPITFQELNEKKREHQPEAILSFTDRILFWGNSDEIYRMLDQKKIRSIQAFELDDPVLAIAESSILKSFFEEALARALCNEKPLVLRRNRRTYYLVVERNDLDNSLLQPLRTALSNRGQPGDISGLVPGSKEVTWAEALSIKLEERESSLWLLIRPDIWITPLKMRQDSTDFLRNKKIRRYNDQAYRLLDAWIKLLFGAVGTAEEVQVSCFSDAEYPAVFKVNTRTAYSFGGE